MCCPEKALKTIFLDHIYNHNSIKSNEKVFKFFILYIFFYISTFFNKYALFVNVLSVIILFVSFLSIIVVMYCYIYVYLLVMYYCSYLFTIIFCVHML